MERDEEGTYSRIGNLRREVIEPGLSEHQDGLIKATGDGFLAEFASPSWPCAARLRFRAPNPTIRKAAVLHVHITPV
jgi:class 3 adenylate cyclase